MPAPVAFPASFNKVPVRAKYVDLGETPAQGSVTFTAAATVMIAEQEHVIVIGKPLVVPLVGGAFEINLPATDDPDIDPTNFTYLVEEKFVGLAGRKYSIEVPLAALDSGGVDLSEAAPAIVSPGSPLPFILDQLADVISAGAAAGTVLHRDSDGFWRPVALTSTDIGNVETVASNAWLKNRAADLDALVVGAITRDSNGAATSAPVVWPDGTPGTYTATDLSDDFPGAVDAYQVTYGSPVTKIVTQPAVTRDSAGAVTTRPALTVA